MGFVDILTVIRHVILNLWCFRCTFLCVHRSSWIGGYGPTKILKFGPTKTAFKFCIFFNFSLVFVFFIHIFQFCSLSNYVYIGSHVWVRNSIFHPNYFRYTTTIWDVFLCVLSCSAKQCLPFRYNFPICSLRFCTFYTWVLLYKYWRGSSRSHSQFKAIVMPSLSVLNFGENVLVL